MCSYIYTGVTLHQRLDDRKRQCQKHLPLCGMKRNVLFNNHFFGAVTVLLANCSNVHRHFHTHFCLSCPHRLAVAYIPETFMSPWNSSHDSLDRKHVWPQHRDFSPDTLRLILLCEIESRAGLDMFAAT